MKNLSILALLTVISATSFARQTIWKCNQGNGVVGQATIITENEQATIMAFDQAPYTLKAGEWINEPITDGPRPHGVLAVTISDLVNNQSWRCLTALTPDPIVTPVTPMPPRNDVKLALMCHRLGGSVAVNIFEDGMARIVNVGSVDELRADQFEVRDTVLGHMVQFLDLRTNTSMMCEIR